MGETTHPDLDAAAAEALAIGDVASAVIVTSGGDGAPIELAAAAGIEGAPLAGLMNAVQQPAHPVNRAFTDPSPTFDVRPMNPGGPALRSHLPVRVPGEGSGRRAAAVLALAHESVTSDADRRVLTQLAARVAEALEHEARDRR